MTDTPRTENARIDNADLTDWGTGKSEFVHADFARELERELNAAMEDKKRLDWLESTHKRVCLLINNSPVDCSRQAVDLAMKGTIE